MLNLSLKAREDLRIMYWQGLEMFGQIQADRYIDGLLGTLDLIADFPGMGRRRSELGPSGRAHTYKSHVILYRIEASGDVRVQRIRHGLEDWQTDRRLDVEIDGQ